MLKEVTVEAQTNVSVKARNGKAKKITTGRNLSNTRLETDKNTYNLRRTAVVTAITIITITIIPKINI